MASGNEQEAVEKDFSRSWDGMERFFSHLSSYGEWWHWMKPILDLITSLRTRGYDHQFRAGQSVHYFLLSRARYHHLRSEQAFVVFALKPEGGMEVSYYEGDVKLVEHNIQQVAITPEVESVLQRLLAQPIN